MSHTLIYIDADNFDHKHAGSLLTSLLGVFGLEAIITVFHSSDECRPHPKQKKSAEAWTRACGVQGLDLVRVQPANGHKNSADIALIVRIFSDLFCKNSFSEQQRKDLTLVIVSGDSDFYHVTSALRLLVKKTIICGRNQINDRYKKTTRFLAYESLIGIEKPQPPQNAGKFIISALSNLPGNVLLNVDDIEHHLVNTNLGYWPMLYGCKSTSELLSHFNVAIGDQPVSAYSILQIMKPERIPLKVIPPSKPSNEHGSVQSKKSSQVSTVQHPQQLLNRSTASNPHTHTQIENSFTIHRSKKPSAFQLPVYNPFDPRVNGASKVAYQQQYQSSPFVHKPPLKAGKLIIDLDD
ncbi:hypothetical protein GEMRC1_012528 [Eukaryota sp. GEM-RC1]